VFDGGSVQDVAEEAFTERLLFLRQCHGVCVGVVGCKGCVFRVVYRVELLTSNLHSYAYPRVIGSYSGWQ
jgi:hypothetical protein